MYKYGKIVILSSTLASLVFIFSAFKGFQFWYAGFVFFLWLTLGFWNYRHDTSLWLFKNRFKEFLKFYLALVILSFFADFIIGQRLTDLWTYPHYNSVDDWIRLYFIIYPFGGLSVLELIYFLSNVFGEKFIFIHRPLNVFHKFIDKLDLALATLLLFIVFVAPVLISFEIIKGFTPFLVWSFIVWTIVATIKFRYHIRHWLHWVSILLATLFMSVFLHEIPNTAVFEWKYNEAPILNQNILGIPLWVVLGWYLIVLLMLRLWIYIVLKKKQEW